MDRPERGPSGESRVVMFYRVDIDGRREELGHRLDLLSRVKSWFAAAWPPERIHEMRCVPDGLEVVFDEPWSPWEKGEALPFGRESRWRATYSVRRRRWALAHVRHLDYPDSDKPWS